MTPTTFSEDTTASHVRTDRSSIWRLFLVSSAALYLEIVLIRWLGTEVKIFAFFQNLTLIVCFLGFGVGCFSSSKRGSLLPSAAAITSMVVIVSLPFQAWHNFLKDMSSILSFTTDAQLWATMRVTGSAYPHYLVLSLAIVTVFLMLLVMAMIPLGRWVGHYLESAPNTVGAYSINLVGSLVGIWLLAILAFLWLSPSYWFIAIFALIALSQPFSWRSALATGALLAITLLALRVGKGESDYWSPYQKLSVTDMGDHQFLIDVNNEGYMSIANVTPEYLAKNPLIASNYQNSSYDSPFLFTKNIGRVLVIGSGAGNDVAAALRHGASRVDAVEIDPLISTLGLRLHPEQPYSSPKVHLITNDARNFMRQCQDKYDVIIFGLLDSHTEFSGYSNMRVDNYVYTEESFRDAKRLLNTDGTLILKFEVRGPWSWMGQRFYSMLSHIFPQPPLIYYSSEVGALLHATVFIESDSPYIWRRSSGEQEAAFLNAHPTEFVPSSGSAPTPTTDDWPYVYHRGHSIPRTYFVVSAVILALAIYLVGPLFKPKESSTWQFFLLGAGFMLMETQLVSRLALYFGTTWLVNCIALSGILTVLLLANMFVRLKPPQKLGFFYACLCTALLIDFGVPWGRIPGSGLLVGVLICFAYCVPICIAGIIFTEYFRRFNGSSEAFGANMLGAVAGGLAQNLSFIFGLKALLLVAIAAYGLAAILDRSRIVRSILI
jgi:spermidine synthase